MLKVIFLAVLLNVAYSQYPWEDSSLGGANYWKRGITKNRNCVEECRKKTNEPSRQPENTDCLTDCRTKPAELAFVVDASTSIWQENFTRCLDFIANFVNDYEISPNAVRVSMVTFGDQANIQDAFGLDKYTDKESLLKAIARVKYTNGNTNTSDGIRYMLNSQMTKARRGVRRVAIVITDGVSQDTDATEAAANEAADAGLEVIAVGVGREVSPEDIENIASEKDNVFYVDSYNALENIKRKLAFTTCGVLPVPPCQHDPIDMAFVIDSSRSLSRSDYELGVKFVTRFIEIFHVNPDSVRVAAITFGEGVYPQDAIQFDQYSHQKQVTDALSRYVHREGERTDTGVAIRYMREVLMSKSRPRVVKVCFVLTDGESTNTELTKTQAKQARSEGILMFAVGVGHQASKPEFKQELQDIAGAPSRVLTADQYSELGIIRDQLSHTTCKEINQQKIPKRPKSG